MTDPNTDHATDSVVKLVIFAGVVGAVLIGFSILSSQGQKTRNALVVYCAHDSVYSQQVLRAFEFRTGIKLKVRFDSEATKSLGLIEQIVQEADAPRCDVFWNNELLGMLDLAEKDLLHPYKGRGYNRIPERYKDPEGRWTGFAARLRVYIVNTDKMQLNASTLTDRLAGPLDRFAIAKPLYGTTLTQYAVLWHQWGPDKLKAWHQDYRTRNAKEVNGNAAVKNLVAQGVCDFGLTDTDDFFLAKDAGDPVDMLPVRLDSGETIAIPNTVAIIKGTTRIREAQQLVDYLLSAESERLLANSKSRQVPLGRVDRSQLNDEVKALIQWTKQGYPLNDLSTARNQCLDWLKSEYVK